MGCVDSEMVLTLLPLSIHFSMIDRVAEISRLSPIKNFPMGCVASGMVLTLLPLSTHFSMIDPVAEISR